MTEQEKRKLNEKLAKWAGFRQLPVGKSGFHWERYKRVGNWMPPDKTETWQSKAYLPNFTDSFDAYKEWLVPNLEFVSVEWSCQPSVSREGHARAFIRTMANLPTQGAVGGLTFKAVGRTQSLALCLAVEKLIDTQNE